MSAVYDFKAIADVLRRGKPRKATAMDQVSDHFVCQRCNDAGWIVPGPFSPFPCPVCNAWNCKGLPQP
jgi:rubrerythrin